MIISGGYIDCFITAKSPTDNYYEFQHHHWQLSPSQGQIDISGIHMIPYKWTVTGSGSKTGMTWTINGYNPTQQYFQTLLQSDGMIHLTRWSSQGGAPHTITGSPNIDGIASEHDYLPPELHWSPALNGPFTGGTWRVVHFTVPGKRGIHLNVTFRLPSMPGLEQTGANDAASQLAEPAPRTNVADWYWEIDF
jgi:hypothetical protein